jgi:hypothetical protein
MQNNITSTISSIVSNASSKSDKDREAVGRHAYDPKGNRHCFQHGMSPAWWDAQNNAQLAEFTREPMVLLRGAGLDFDVIKAETVSMLDNGEIIRSTPAEYNLLRSDDHRVRLQTGVSGSYSTIPYRDIIRVPNEVVISAEDFEDKSVSEFVENLTDKDLFSGSIPVNEILTPAGASSWANGKVMTFQYYIGTFEPRPGDAHRVYFNIESSLDGSKATRYYLTVVRVVCENTQLHAEQDGWRKLLASQKNLQRIRRTTNMDARIAGWHGGIASVLAGASQTADVFKMLANKKIADTAAERQRIILSFVENAFELKPKGESKTAVTKASNTLTKVLDLAIYEERFGGGNCETWIDLWNGVTSWNQHFAQVNGLDTESQREERRYMRLLLDDGDKAQSQKQFAYLLQLANAS